MTERVQYITWRCEHCRGLVEVRQVVDDAGGTITDERPIVEHLREKHGTTGQVHA